MKLLQLKDMEPNTNSQEKSHPLLIPFSIIVAGALVGAGFFLGDRESTSPTVRSNVIESIPIRPVSSDDHILGNPNAEILLVEYSDTECPFCKTFHTTLKRIISEYGKEGKVAWVFRHFPVHNQSVKEAEAAECVAEIGGNSKFWEYVDIIFARTPSNDGLDLNDLPRFAEEIDINIGRFNSCLSSGKYANKIRADFDDARQAGGRGTPFTVLITASNDKIAIEGAESYETIKIYIDAALGELAN